MESMVSSISVRTLIISSFSSTLRFEIGIDGSIPVAAQIALAYPRPRFTFAASVRTTSASLPTRISLNPSASRSRGSTWAGGHSYTSPRLSVREAYSVEVSGWIITPSGSRRMTFPSRNISITRRWIPAAVSTCRVKIRSNPC